MTAFVMRISDWSSNVCSSDLPRRPPAGPVYGRPPDSLGCLGPGRCARPLSVPSAGSLWGENHGCSPAPIAAARPALMNSLIVPAKLNAVDPHDLLAAVTACIAKLPQHRHPQFLRPTLKPTPPNTRPQQDTTT